MSHFNNLQIPPPPETPGPDYTWQAIWSIFVRAPRVRAWLFQKDPPSRSQLVQSLVSSPMLVGYVFSSQYSHFYAFPDIGDLITVSCRDGDVLLGFHFGFKGINPIMPLLFQVAKDPLLGNPNVVVRRTARQRAPPPHDDYILTIEFNWYESGALGVVTMFCEADSDTEKLAGRHSYVKYAAHRVFDRKTAIRLSRTAEILDSRLDPTASSTLPASDLPIDFIDPPDDYYILTVREPPESVASFATRVPVCRKQQSFEVEKEFGLSAANANSTTTVHTTSQSSNFSSEDSCISGQSPSPFSAATPEKAPNRTAHDGRNVSCSFANSCEDVATSIADPCTARLWQSFQQKVKNSRRIGVYVTMLGKKVGGRFAPEVHLFGRESRYLFLSTSGISVPGRIQRLCSQLNIKLGNPLQDQLLLSTEVGKDQHDVGSGAGNSAKDSENSGGGGGNKTSIEHRPTRIHKWHIPHFEPQKLEPKEEPSIAHWSMSDHEQSKLSGVACHSTALANAPSILHNGKRSDNLEGTPLRKRRRCTDVTDIVDSTDNVGGVTLLAPMLASVPSATSYDSPISAELREKPQFVPKRPPPRSLNKHRRSFDLTELLSDRSLDASRVKEMKEDRIQASQAEDVSTSGTSSVRDTITAPAPSLNPNPGSAFNELAESKADDETAKGAPGSSKEKNNNKMIWTCDRCGVKIRGKKGNLNRHIANKHEFIRAFACSSPNCGRRFQTRLNLVRHENAVHQGRPFQCEHCPRSFKVEEDRAAHIKSAHSEPDAQLACEVCGSCFGRRSTLNRHMAKVHKSRKTSVIAM